MKSRRLKDKVVVITGGGGVLCKSMALEVAAHGAKVAVLDLHKEAADAVANKIVAQGGVAIGIGSTSHHDSRSPNLSETDF